MTKVALVCLALVLFAAVVGARTLSLNEDSDPGEYGIDL